MKRNGETITTIDLGHDQMWLVESADDGRVRVLYGGVWLTEEGGRSDAVLRAGDEFTLSQPGRTVIEALRESRLELARPQVDRLRGALRRAMQGAARRLAQWCRRMQLGAACS